MSSIAKALASRWSKSSITADEWPGVIASGPNWRISLNRSALRYIVQRPASGGRRAWGPLLVPTHRPDRVAGLDAAFSGLPDALAALPVDPIDAAARLAAAQGIRVPVRRRKDWLADDYPFVLARDENLRIVRDAGGTVYAVQWRPILASHGGNRGDWITQYQSPSATYLIEKMVPKLGEIRPDGRNRDGVPERFTALFEGLPEYAADGPWHLPKGPSAA